MWINSGFENESDVEQKLIYPLLVEPRPNGLGFPPSTIQTKVNIRRFSIGKGSDKKLYYPDYIIVTMGFPLVVIEAKSPGESVEEGYRQARLYAAELNSLYAHGVAPAKYVFATNGVEIWAGFSDQANPQIKTNVEDLNIYSQGISDVIDLLSWDTIERSARDIAQEFRPAGFFKPRRLVGGAGMQNEEISTNSFGATVTAAISKVFNPETSVERSYIAKNAYIPSRRRNRYVDPIDRVIRAAKPPSETNARPLEDTSKPGEVLEKIKASRDIEHKILLIIGSVGSGKSTFIDYLQEVALPRELADASVWCRLNMNFAPVSASEIYPWLREEIIKACKLSLPLIDFDELDNIKKVYGSEISRFEKGVGRLYAGDQGVFNIKLGELLESLERDRHATALAYLRFSCGERGKISIIVLDNCDKKTRDEQLLMFEAAQWLKEEFRSLVILPLRDETYDNHKDQPPLDTALKDMVFRIEPPLFQHVLMKRVQLALKVLESESKEKLTFSLPNGFNVEYPKSEQAFYLTSILKSLFEHDRFARRMIVGLAGRNMRKALEIFLEFCNSGYIGDDQIFKIRQSEGNHVLPFHQVATVLLRMNRRFYDSDHSYVKNIFSASPDDDMPSYFCRYMILKWLRNNFKTAGTKGLQGYFPKWQVKSALVPYGLAPEVIDREFNYLLAGQCVIAEHLRTDNIFDEDLVRLGPAGFVHLDLVGNINYLAAVAEDTFFEDRMQAEAIAARIRAPESQLHIQTAIDNATEVVEFLDGVRSKIHPANGKYLEHDILTSISDFPDAKESLSRVVKSRADDPWFNADKKIKRGSRQVGLIINCCGVGHFVEFDDGLVGLIHKSKLNGSTATSGDVVKVEVLWVDVIQKKMGLKFLEIVREEVGDMVDGAYVSPED